MKHSTAQQLSTMSAHLDEGSKAVGCAGSVGDDVILVLVVLFVDTTHECWDVVTLGRCCNDDLLGSSLKQESKNESL